MATWPNGLPDVTDIGTPALAGHKGMEHGAVVPDVIGERL
jgi:hypothetical protein